MSFDDIFFRVRNFLSMLLKSQYKKIILLICFLLIGQNAFAKALPVIDAELQSIIDEDIKDEPDLQSATSARSQVAPKPPITSKPRAEKSAPSLKSKEIPEPAAAVNLDRATKWLSSTLNPSQKNFGEDEGIPIFDEKDFDTKSVPGNENALSFGQLLKMAVFGHPTVEGKKIEVEGAEMKVKSAKLLFLPEPSVGTTLFQGDLSNTVTLSQPIWTGGRLTSNLNSADIKRQIAIIDVADTQFKLGLKFVDLYQSFLAQRFRLAILDRGLRRLEKLQAMMERRVEAGVSSKIDLNMTRSRLEQIKTEKEVTASRLKLILIQLSSLTGAQVSTETVDAEYEIPGNIDLKNAEQRAISSNPSVIRAQAEQRLAFEQKNLAEASQWPTLSLNSEYQRSQFNGSSAQKTRLFFNLSYKPGAGFSSYADVSAASYLVSAANQLTEAAELSVSDSVKAEVVNLQTYKMQLASQSKASALSKEILNSSTRLFVLGRRSWLDLLNFEKELIVNQQQETDLRAQIIASQHRLNIITGDFYGSGSAKGDAHDYE